MDTNMVRQQNMVNYQKLRHVVDQYLKKPGKLRKPFDFLTGIPVVDKIYAVSGKYSSRDFIHALHMDVLELYDSMQKESSNLSSECVNKALGGKNRYQFNYSKMNAYCNLSKNMGEALYKLIMDKGIEQPDNFWLPKQLLIDIRDHVRLELYSFLSADNPWKEDDDSFEEEGFEQMRLCVKKAILEDEESTEENFKKKKLKEAYYNSLLAQYSFWVMYLIEYAKQYTIMVQACYDVILQEMNKLELIRNINILLKDMSESMDFISNMLLSISCYSALLWQLEFYNFGALRMNVAFEDSDGDKIWWMMEAFYNLCDQLGLNAENMFLDDKRGTKENVRQEKGGLNSLYQEAKKAKREKSDKGIESAEPPEGRSRFTKAKGLQLQKERTIFVERNYKKNGGEYDLKYIFKAILVDYFEHLSAWVKTGNDEELAQSEIYFANEYSDMVRE